MKTINTNSYIQPVDKDPQNMDTRLDQIFEVYALTNYQGDSLPYQGENYGALHQEDIDAISDVKLQYEPSHYIQKNHQMRAFIKILSETGVTVPEALQLSWTDVFHNPHSLRFQLNNESRMVPITISLYGLLLGLPRLSQNIFSLIFDEIAVNEDINQRAKVSGLKKVIYAQQLRHTFIVQSLANGHTAQHIAELLGYRPQSSEVYIPETNYKRDMIVDMNQWPVFWNFLCVERERY